MSIHSGLGLGLGLSLNEVQIWANITFTTVRKFRNRLIESLEKKNHPTDRKFRKRQPAAV